MLPYRSQFNNAVAGKHPVAYMRAIRGQIMIMLVGTPAFYYKDEIEYVDPNGQIRFSGPVVKGSTGTVAVNGKQVPSRVLFLDIPNPEMFDQMRGGYIYSIGTSGLKWYSGGAKSEIVQSAASDIQALKQNVSQGLVKEEVLKKVIEEYEPQSEAEAEMIEREKELISKPDPILPSGTKQASIFGNKNFLIAGALLIGFYLLNKNKL